MFDITSSKLMILAIIALLVVGPKDLPVLLRTVGKYLGVIRRHANEFRAQLEEALREAEFEDIKKDFEKVGEEVEATMQEGTRAIESNVQQARTDIDDALEDPTARLSPGANGAGEPRPALEPQSEPEHPEKTGP
jgi:sec-independent protein translocase protein TatB